MKDFIKIKEQRVRKNTIKKYLPYGDKSLNIYYNTSRYKIELETFVFESKQQRDNLINKLDLYFGVDED